MDESVIEIDDSIITVESDADVEDGELKDVDNADKNNAINLQQPPANESNNQSAIEDESLIFEVTFHRSHNYDGLQERVFNAFKAIFAEEEFEYKTNETSISVHAKAEVPQPHSDFLIIDTAPSPRLNAAQIPSYKRCHIEVLDEDTTARKKLKLEEANKCFRPKPQSACFNCGGTDHSLRDCTLPRNQARIQRARKKKVDRYHVDTEQRFAHIRPGRISSKTRHAMGFSRGELPFMFYRMRVLGYPPAWLEEAKVQSSGITLFNADGSEVQAPDQEEGESESFKYDANKIIEFPGFNVDPGPKFFDDFQHHNVPCFQQQQLKENFIKSLGENVTKGYKRKKLVDLPAPHDAVTPVPENGTNLVEDDMDLDDDEEPPKLEITEPPLPLEQSVDAVPPPPPAEVESIRSVSPTLEDLRAQQAELLEALESNTSINTSGVEEKVPEDEMNASGVEAKEPEAGVVKEIASQTAPTPAQSSTPSQTSIFKAPSIVGTPILKFSEFDKLPVGENFKVGVSDVINFENLPDSTGKYEQMKDLLKNVRRKMNELQNSDD